MTRLVHVSDVIAINDTSVWRLYVQYCLLVDHLGKGDYYISFYGIDDMIDDEKVGCKARNCMKNLADCDDNVVFVVNSASRAKHHNNTNAKGSNCLLARVQTNTNRKPVYVVGVDEDAFAMFGSNIQEIRYVNSIDTNDIFLPDLSKGSQFRSLEHWPIAQMLVEREKRDGLQIYEMDKKIGDFSTIEQLSDNVFSDKSCVEVVHDEPNIVLQSRLLQSLGIIMQFYNSTTFVAYTRLMGYLDRNKYEHYIVQHKSEKVNIYIVVPDITNLDMFDIEGEIKMIDTAYIEKKNKERKLESNMIDEFFCISNFAYDKDTANVVGVKELQTNELYIVDRDKFGNCKCLSAFHDGVYGIIKYLDVAIGTQIAIHSSNNLLGYCFLTESLTNMTGYNCCWNGSSKGPNGYVLVELNKSFDASLQKRNDIQSIPLGTKLTFTVF